jgi:glycosyltransferase involved in cell wall biosynthesis
MKILLIGNYPILRSQSMDRFAAFLSNGLKDKGHDVRLLKPEPVLGRIWQSATGFGKWLGYLDRFLLFRSKLNKAATWADVVHICDQANAVYSPLLNGKPHVVTCHDMLSIRSAFNEFDETTINPTGRVYQRWILSGLKQSRHIACVSKATYDDVLRLAGLETDKVSLVQNSLNYPYRRMDETECRKHLEQIGLDYRQSFFIHVGGNYWYKNKKGLLRIFSHLACLKGYREHQLVLAGEVLDSKLRYFAKKIGISGHLREIADVSNDQLCAVYSSADGLIFPSLAEGFGWPIIEAQACGCPVFTSNRSPMIEVGGDAAVYFDPLDEIGAAGIISEATPSKHLIREGGYQNNKKFSKNEMLSEYLDCYRFTISLGA